MKNAKRTIVYVVYILFGIALLVMGYQQILDAFWSGMGSALLLIGVLRLIGLYRLNKDENYREKVEIETTDERNRFIRNKAWAWAGYLFILIVASSVIILKLMGQELLSMAASFAVCLMMVLYWVSYCVLKRKY